MFVEYAKADAEDILIKITVANRGPEAAQPSPAADGVVSQHMVVGKPRRAARELHRHDRAPNPVIELNHDRLASAGCIAKALRSCCSPRTKPTRSGCSESTNRTPYVKDGINDYIVHGTSNAVNPERTGTKAAAHYKLTIGAGETVVVRLRLDRTLISKARDAFDGFR